VVQLSGAGQKDKVTIPYFKSLSELNITPVRIQYLGTLQGSPCYSAEAKAESANPEGMEFIELRSLYSVLDEDIFLLAGKATQIVSWDQTNNYCGRCGTKMEPLEGERAKICPVCRLINYPRISPAAITAVIKGNKILLTHNAAFKGNIHSLIAGFVEPGETIEECVHREIFEEVGLKVNNLKYFGSQPWPFPNSLMIGFTAEYKSGEISVDGQEITEAGWYDAGNLPELPGKMSIARKIIEWFVKTQSP
jgi:NAD+ diphosphatase